jgi:hypothetical protein
MPEPKDKVEEEKHITKTPEYRKFKKLLKQSCQGTTNA